MNKVTQSIYQKKVDDLEKIAKPLFLHNILIKFNTTSHVSLLLYTHSNVAFTIDTLKAYIKKYGYQLQSSGNYIIGTNTRIIVSGVPATVEEVISTIVVHYFANTLQVEGTKVGNVSSSPSVVYTVESITDKVVEVE